MKKDTYDYKGDGMNGFVMSSADRQISLAVPKILMGEMLPPNLKPEEIAEILLKNEGAQKIWEQAKYFMRAVELEALKHESKYTEIATPRAGIAMRFIKSIKKRMEPRPATDRPH